LLACFLALKQGLREKLEEPIPAASARAGLADTLLLALEALRAIEPAGPEPLAAFQALDDGLQQAQRQVEAPTSDLLSWHRWLEQLQQTAQALPDGARLLGRELREEPAELLRWVDAFARQVAERRDELAGLSPWLVLRAEPADDKVPPGLRQHLAAVASIGEFQQQAEAILAELEGLQAATGPTAASLRKAVLDSSAPDLLARCQNLADRAG